VSPSEAAHPDTAWTSNVSLDQIAERLRAAPSVTLITHIKPDGDAVGSTLALARTLTRVGVRATPIYTPPWSPRFDGVVNGTPAVFLDPNAPTQALPTQPGVVLVLDTGSWSQLEGVRPWLQQRREQTILIDHHLHGDGDVAAARHIDTRASAACQPAAELCRLLLNAETPADLPPDVAEPLYVGLATDTGWFRHANVTPEAFALASALLRAGADHAKIYQQVEQMDRPARLRLLGRAMASVELFAEERIAVMMMRRRDFEECCGDLEDAGGLTDMLLTIAPVRVAASFTEVDENQTKVSFRSKRSFSENSDAVDVNEVARKLGGGGHAQAAGARLDLPLREAKEKVVAVLIESLENGAA